MKVGEAVNEISDQPRVDGAQRLAGRTNADIVDLGIEASEALIDGEVIYGSDEFEGNGPALGVPPRGAYQNLPALKHIEGDFIEYNTGGDNFRLAAEGNIVGIDSS